MKYLSLDLPGHPGINTPGNIPYGGEEKLIQIIQVIISFLFLFTIVFALFVLVLSGFQWITSSGDKQKVGQIRQRLAYTIVGLVVVLLSVLVVNLVAGIFGINVLNIPKVP